MKYDRMNAIETFVQEKESCTNEEICNKFDISMQTLRRDLRILEQRGTIQKVYGGVVCNHNEITRSVPSNSSRSEMLAPEKERIGKEAASLVNDGDVIFIDSGTTTCRMVPYLANLKELTVITHSLSALELLQSYAAIRVIVLGGELDRNARSFMADETKIPFSFDKAFMATVGIDAEGCTNTNLLEGRIKSYVIEHAKKSWILADHSKFSVTGFNRFCSWERIRGIITDSEIPGWINQVEKRTGLEILQASRGA